ncbi:hypothetical protein N7510_007337 [Penicillium lagena]|uniref:uncharacterized protein n=1 Tax=Penicillium lagena TaxID=94218 RepID=UPI00253F9AE5|nr:uncharacterized protein N7510_007337 [Penicillium lagena]KAJ5610618.1 hypothetical protein N7510_007337 [Penicillium lagena]
MECGHASAADARVFCLLRRQEDAFDSKLEFARSFLVVRDGYRQVQYVESAPKRGGVRAAQSIHRIHTIAS